MSGSGSTPQVTETGDQVEQAKINTELWNYYQKNYKPLIDKYAAKVTDPATQDLQEKNVAGKINASVMKNITPAGASINPVAGTKKLSALAEIGTGEQLKGQEKVKAKQIGDIQNVISIGRGEAATASTGMGDLASLSVQSAIQDKEIQQQADASTENAIGSMAGIAAAGYLRPKKLILPYGDFGFGPGSGGY